MEIALNKESKRKTLANIAFRDGHRSFGDDAAIVGLRFPQYSFHYLLDLLGKTVDNPIVKLYQTRFPYYNIEADPERNTVVFKLDENTKYSVEELIAQILQKSRDYAEISTGLCQFPLKTFKSIFFAIEINPSISFISKCLLVSSKQVNR